MYIRPAAERGLADFGWLRSRHTFSFGSYHDPRFMGFGNLRVINDDRVMAGKGFGTHGHQDMEIISYVLQGALEHRDSLGTGTVIRPGDVQRMSAGTGIRHSEFNPSPTDPVHFLQIWILTRSRGIQPSYEQKHFPPEALQGGWRLIVSPDGAEGSVSIHQDARAFAARLRPGEVARHALAPDRKAWLHLARGSARLPGHDLTEGDGVAFEAGELIELSATAEAEALLFEV